MPDALLSMRFTTPLPNTKLAKIVNSPAIPTHTHTHTHTHIQRGSIIVCMVLCVCMDVVYRERGRED